jgi:hypothetical protein
MVKTPPLRRSVFLFLGLILGCIVEVLVFYRQVPHSKPLIGYNLLLRERSGEIVPDARELCELLRKLTD